MIIDCHTHIFPPSICSERERFMDGEPAFKLLYESPKSKLIGASQLVATMDSQGIERSVVFGFPWRNLESARLNNDYVMEAVARFSPRLIGMACVDLTVDGASDEIQRCLDQGLQGAGELAFYKSGIDRQGRDALAPVMEMCADRNLPVMIHTNEPVGHQYPGKTPNTLVQIYRMVKRFAGNNIILAHWGGGLFFYSLLKKEINKVLENVYFDTAASPFLYRPEIYRLAADMVGPEKILFGSDHPLLPPKRYFDEMDKSGLAGEEKAKICGLNAARLFKLE